MSIVKHNHTARQKRIMRVRRRIIEESGRFRLTVYRSNKHILAQVIDDKSNKVVAVASDLGKHKIVGTKTTKAEKVATILAEQLKGKVKDLVFDRGAYRYHGRVKMIAETMRQLGFNL